MRTFHIAKANGHRLTQEQYCFLDLTFSKLVASDVDMAATLDNVDIHLDGSDFRKITIDEPEKRIKELEEIMARLHDELHKCIENDRNSETIARIEKELTDVRRSLDALYSLDGNVYEEMLLGSYHYDHTIQKGVITLYVNNINKAAKSLPWHKQGLEYLTGYVFAHEAHHAYYDVNHSRTSVNEIEETMAEFGALTFLKNNALPNFGLALSEVKRKKYSPCWTSAYGFGAYVYSQRNKSLIGTYRNNNTGIATHPLISEYQARFVNGYPWDRDEENTCYGWLEHIINLKTSTPRSKSKAKRNTKKYIFNGISYCKRRLVLAVISDYASKHSIHTVKTYFDPVKNGNREVVKKYSTLSLSKPNDFDRYFVGNNELIADIASPQDKYAVDNQWGIGPEFDNFLKVACKLGYIIK